MPVKDPIRREKLITAARPSKNIDWEIAAKLLASGCNGVQVAAYFGVHPETLYDRCVKEKNLYFSDFSQECKQKGNAMLFNKQFELAMKSDKTMLVWLGKNRLGQVDKMEQTVKADVEISRKKVLVLPDDGNLGE